MWGTTDIHVGTFDIDRSSAILQILVPLAPVLCVQYQLRATSIARASRIQSFVLVGLLCGVRPMYM